MTKLANFIERRATNSGYVLFIREVWIKYNSKIAYMRARCDRYALKRYGRIGNFRTLLVDPNEKVFSFSRIDS